MARHWSADDCSRVSESGVEVSQLAIFNDCEGASRMVGLRTGYNDNVIVGITNQYYIGLIELIYLFIVKRLFKPIVNMF